MKKHHYEVAKEAFTVLEFYSDHYASNEDYQREFQKVNKLLKEKANSYTDGSRGRNFLIAFSGALEKENTP
jgi:hypothetical protein